MRLKHFIVTSLLFSFVLAIWQCKEDNPNDKGPACNIANADLTYAKNMKRMIDQKCISCHDGSGKIGPGDFTAYDKMKKLIDNGEILEHVVIDKSMPQSGVPMTQAQRDSMNCWLKAGAPK